jgi:hypothetical protein
MEEIEQMRAERVMAGALLGFCTRWTRCWTLRKTGARAPLWACAVRAVPQGMILLGASGRGVELFFSVVDVTLGGWFQGIQSAGCEVASSHAAQSVD